MIQTNFCFYLVLLGLLYYQSIYNSTSYLFRNGGKSSDAAYEIETDDENSDDAYSAQTDVEDDNLDGNCLFVLLTLTQIYFCE